jgi:hypothetical protein
MYFGRSLLLAIACGLAACGFPTKEDPTSLQKLSASLDLALNWLDLAHDRTTGTPSKTEIRNIADVLEHRQIVLEGPNDPGYCADNTEEEFTLAYIVQPITSSSSPIRVCTETLTFNSSVVAQVLIHEGLHGTNVTSECSTTSKEISIVALAGERPFKNAYVDDPACASFNLGNGINFVILEDGSEAPIPIRFRRDIHMPRGARYMKAPRNRQTPLLHKMFGPESLPWLKSLFR